MAFTLALFHEPDLDAVLKHARARLEQVFPGLRALPSGERRVPASAFDTARRRVDARHVLQAAMPPAPGCDAALWLVQTPLCDAWRPWLYGMAGAGRAVVSVWDTPDQDDAARLCCHEAGHLLGLEHCPKPCVLRVSTDAGRLRALPMALCPGCAAAARRRLDRRTA